MAKQNREMEGDNEQRREAAREARRSGQQPSEVRATLGASKQRKEAHPSQSHQERLEQTNEGKVAGPKDDNLARPGSRDVDPKRTNRRG